MSTIKSSNEHLTINADGSSKDIKFQANGVEKASISSAGAFTSTTIDATKLTGNLPAISGAALTGVGVSGITSSADATAMTITSAEKVGFGTTTPQGIVTVKESNATGINYVVEGAGSAGNTAGIYFTNHGVATPRRKQGIITKKNTGGSSGDYGVGSLHFLLDSNTDDADVAEADSKLEITSDGRGLSQFTAHAWVNLNQTGTQAIRDSHNISSISDEGTGQTKINYSNNIGNSSTDACVVAMGKAGGIIYHQAESSSYWQGEIRNDGGSAEDTSTLTCLVFGD